MGLVAVVSSSPLSERIAAKVDVRLVQDPAAADEGEAVVMVASSAAEVEAVTRAARGPIPLAAVVAWHLPESALVRLLELNIPCLIGEPGVEQLQAALDRGTDGINHREERNASARYAVLESWLNQPAQPIPDALDR